MPYFDWSHNTFVKEIFIFVMNWIAYANQPWDS